MRWLDWIPDSLLERLSLVFIVMCLLGAVALVEHDVSKQAHCLDVCAPYMGEPVMGGCACDITKEVRR